MTRLSLVLVSGLFCSGIALRAQTYLISGGSGVGCHGILYDSGGEGAFGYQNGEDYTFTLCPDVPGNVIYLTFFNFNLNTSGPNPIDDLTIYDGDNTGELTLGTYTGTALQNVIVSGTVFNTTGCLTLVFHSNANGTGVFSAGYQCTTPCEHPTAVASMSEAAPALVCVGEPVSFDGSASFPVGNFNIVQYLWDFDDGTFDSTSGPVVSHAFASDGEYMVQLTVTDDNDCYNLNLVDLQVLVSTTPNFGQTDPSTEVCFGETVTLYGQADPVTWTGIPDANFGDGIFLPDDVGQPFTSTLLFEQFDPGQEVTNTSNIESICVDMEHTFMGDLVLQVICPNGQTTIFHQQQGGGTYIGAPNDFDSDIAPIIGECWHYCWSPTATNGTWIENLANTTTAGTPPAPSIDPGTYESVQPFDNLIGCPLNGEWTFQSSDLWAADNGFICGWEINFDPSIVPDVTQFTPSWGPGSDSSLWTGGTVPDNISGDGDNITFTATAPGTYPFIYQVTDNFGCTYDTTIMVTVDEPFQVDAGADAVICTDPVQLEATIVGASATCEWVLEMNDSFGDGWNSAEMTVTVNGVPTSYTVAFGSQNIASITVSAGDVVALIYTPGTFENEVSYILYDDAGNTMFSDGPFPLTGMVWNGIASCNGMSGMVWSWTPTTGLSDPAVPDPVVSVTSPTVYTVTAHVIGHPACQASDDVSITIDPGADPGLDAVVIICPDAPAFQMLDMLGGTPTSGGTWTDGNGTPVTGTFDPQSDPAGIYLYTVTSVLGCVGTAELDVQVLSANDPQCCGSVNAGGDGALTLCSSDAAVALFPELSGTPSAGGAWTDPNGAVSSGIFMPGVDVAGDYTYTVTGGGNCPPATALISVAVSVPPDAGTDGVLALCSSSAITDLTMSLAGADVGGTWTDPNGNASNGLFIPGVNATGTYTYSVAGVAPCPMDVAQVTVDVTPAPDAGLDGVLDLCANSAISDLFGMLGGTPDAGGVWTDPMNSPHAGSFEPALDAPGDYTYTVTGQTPCPNASSLVSVSVQPLVNAGSDATVNVCTTDAPVDLFTLLGAADAGGTWNFNNSVHSGTFAPGTDVPGAYSYTVNGTAPCPDASAAVIMQLATPPFAGNDAAIVACADDDALTLFAFLTGSPESGGDWSDANGNAMSGTFTLGTDAAGVYTYTVQGVAPCPSDAALVDVAINTPPNAGGDGAITLCISAMPVDLFAQLGGVPDGGGTWTVNGLAHDSNFDPMVDAPGNYVYTVAGLAPCPSASAQVTVNVTDMPDAGTNGAATLCASSSAMDLFAQLGGTPDVGGTWTGPSPVTGNTFDPASMSVGIYTYTINVAPPCVSVSSTVDISIVAPPGAGTDGSLLLCISSPSTDLFTALGGGPQAGGAWTDPDGLPHSGMVDPLVDPAGVYTYTLAGTAPCPDASAGVLVNVVSDADAGQNGAIMLCETGAAVDLFSQLGGTPDAGGTWSGPSPVIDGAFEPGTMTGGVYTYTIDVPAPCVSVSSSVDIAVVAPPDTGSDGASTLCEVSPPTDLFALLDGSPEEGGTWTDPLGDPHGPSFDPLSDIPGGYSYTVLGTAPCPNASAMVEMAVVEAPTAGADGAMNVCITGNAVDLWQALSGADSGGTWSDPQGQSFDGMFLPGTNGVGGYMYTVGGVVLCPEDAAIITVTVLSEPNAGEDGALALCANGGVQELFSALAGTPDTGGEWTGPNGPVANGIFNTALDPAGPYTYVVLVPPPCANDTAMVIISVSSPADPGTDGAITACADGEAITLFEELGGTPQPGGNWSAPDGSSSTGTMDPQQDPPGNYIYFLTGTSPCPDQQAVVSVTVNPPIVASTSVTDAVCHGACDGTAALQVTGGSGAYSFAWPNGLAGAADEQASGICAGSFVVFITDALGCTGGAGFIIAEPPPLVVDGVEVEDETCPGDCDGTIRVIDAEGQLYSSDNGLSWQPLPSFADLCAGTYSIAMQDATGCLATIVVSVESPPPVIAAFSALPDTVTVENTLVQFLNQSGQATSFSWQFGSLGSSTLGDPVFVFPDVVGAEYEVCLEALNDVGCSDTTCRNIVVLDVLAVYAPNAFTPDGDGMNEGFAPVFNIPASVREYELLVFDRWGERIFESNSVEERWDGTVGGEMAKQDVYVWKLHVRDAVSHKVHEHMGSVTLLK